MNSAAAAPFSLLAALLLALVHIMAGRLHVLGGLPRSRWLSIAGGASVAYVFLHLLPELAQSQAALANASPDTGYLRQHAYLVALLGLVCFYGMERMVARSRPSPAHSSSPGGFWIHTGLFAAYNCMVGYLLHERLAEQGSGDLALFTLAMTLHFLVNDYGLRHHHKHQYLRIGRWLLAGAVLSGWALARLLPLGPALAAALLAFIAGAVILNVLKEELPAERDSRFGAFALGAALYALLLLAL